MADAMRTGRNSGPRGGSACRYTPRVAWEIVFMFLILKIPVVYLCAVVWYAIRAEPDVDGGRPEHGDGRTSGPWRPWQSRRRTVPRPRRGGPHGVPGRGYDREPRPAGAQALGAKAEVRR